MTTRVLLIDDTSAYRMLLRLVLEGGGFEVVGEAADGTSGIEQAEALQPDLILLDLSMPVMDGFEALPHLLMAAPAARILVLTGYVQEVVGGRVVEMGAHGIVEKGIRGEDLLDAMHRVIAGERILLV